MNKGTLFVSVWPKAASDVGLTRFELVQVGLMGSAKVAFA